MHFTFVRTIDVVADEARMHAEVRDAASGREYAADLLHHLMEVIHIGVNERHAERLDAARAEWQSMCVCEHRRITTPPRQRELVE